MLAQTSVRREVQFHGKRCFAALPHAAPVRGDDVSGRASGPRDNVRPSLRTSPRRWCLQGVRVVLLVPLQLQSARRKLASFLDSGSSFRKRGSFLAGSSAKERRILVAMRTLHQYSRNHYYLLQLC